MLKENFRTIHNGTEIASLIQHAPEGGQIWQTVGPLRTTYKILSLTVDKANEALLFETQLPFEFDKNYPVYVRVTPSNVIFKLDANYVTKKNRMICSIPPEAKAVEMRVTERFHIPEHKNIHLKLRPLETSAQEVKVKLSDFSQKGLGVLVSSINEDYFQRIDKFSILSINGIKLNSEKTVLVKHIGEKVGLELKDPFDKSTFLLLQNLML